MWKTSESELDHNALYKFNESSVNKNTDKSLKKRMPSKQTMTGKQQSGRIR